MTRPARIAHPCASAVSAEDQAPQWPMIVGLGSDIVDIRRIAHTLDRFGERFTHRVFTALERARAERRAKPEQTYARRFAAKEACAKALGTGLRNGCLLARHGGGQSPHRPADDRADRRRNSGACNRSRLRA